jgi:hypothetical protein
MTTPFNRVVLPRGVVRQGLASDQVEDTVQVATLENDLRQRITLSAATSGAVADLSDLELTRIVGA